MPIVLQLVGIAGSIFGLYGYYTSNMTFMVAGLVVAFLFCKMNQVSIVEHILARITVIPLPFSTVILHQGKAMYVPSQLDQAAIEAWRLKLEQELNQLYDAAWTALGKEAHDQDLHPSRSSQGLHGSKGRDE